MKKTTILQRTGIFITIIGLAILCANITSRIGSTRSGNFSVAPNGTYLEVVYRLRNRPIEFRINVPKAFEGTFYLFDYEGIRRLTEGTKTPILEENIKGSTLIDYTINRRGAYMIMIESHVSTQTEGSIGIVEKEAISQDLIWDSTRIVIIGIATTILATIPKITQLHKPNKLTKT